MKRRITHIRKPNVNSTIDHITHVKGLSDSGHSFEEPVHDTISAIKNHVHTYYVRVSNFAAVVTVQRSASGNEYIKTEPDNTGKDNLLSLPQF